MERHVSNLRQTKNNLEAEIQQKKKQIQYVKQPVQYIYLPENETEVTEYLETLSDSQLLAISQLITPVLTKRAARALENEAIRIQREGDANVQKKIREINRSLGLP